MSEHEPTQKAGVMDRREFLRGVGAAAVAAAALATHGNLQAAPAPAQPAALPSRPNILILMTDQERAPVYWPANWAAENLPARNRLLAHGLEFRHAFCNTSMCSPSRATLFTGLFPAQHGVTDTLTPPGTSNDSQHYLPLDIQNMGKLLASAGYNVQWRGKWHMSKGDNNTEPTTDDIAAYGYAGWVPPDAGGDTLPDDFGGGCANHDQPYTDQAIAFLNSVSAADPTPWALIVCLVNPHDVLSFPTLWDGQSDEAPNCYNYRDDAPGCFEQGIGLPPTHQEHLLTNYKPIVQVQSLELLAAGLGILDPVRREPEKYVNFYGFLQKHVDAQLGSILDALDNNPGLADKTVIIRLADHGELGLSHGGMRQKIFNVYEEMLNVPMIISNPLLFPTPAQTDAIATLLDIMPTLATLAEAPNRDAFTFKGVDLSPVIVDASDNPANPTVTVQDSMLFTFDDQNVGTPGGQSIVQQPGHIRAVRTQRYKYALYFDPEGVAASQYELYDLQEDPQELHNMARPDNPDYYDPRKVEEMHLLLNAKLAAAGIGTFPFPSAYLPFVSDT